MKLLVYVVFACLVAAISAAPRIFGGQKAPEGKYPYAVSIKLNGEHICGGSILNKNWILTAAHCVQGFEASSLTVLVGSNQLDEKNTDKVYQAKYTVGHKNFSRSNTENDIGLIRVDREIKFNERVGSVSLPKVDSSKNVTSAVFSGWGFDYAFEVSRELQELTLKIYDHDKCKSFWNSLPYIVGKNQICTLNKFRVGVCRGDSGGPLVVDGVQIGIQSYGTSWCSSGEPDVFTKVYSYLDWISEQIKNEKEESDHL